MVRIMRRNKIIIIIISIIIMLFGVISLVWYLRYIILFKPLINDYVLMNSKHRDDRYLIHYTEGVPEDYATLSVYPPEFLSFSGNICITSDFLVDTATGDSAETGYDITLLYNPSLFKKNNTLYWQMLEYDETGNTGDSGCVIITDTKLNLIEEESFPPTVLNYDECKDKMQFYYDNYLIGTFGEEYFNK